MALIQEAQVISSSIIASDFYELGLCGKEIVKRDRSRDLVINFDLNVVELDVLKQRN